MKNAILLLLLSMASFSCKKESAPNAIQPPLTNSIENAAVASSGKIIFSEEGDQGSTATIYLRKDGVYVLALEKMDYKTAFDMNVYISLTGEVTNASIKLFSAKNFSGNMYYTLPPGINIAAFKHLIIQNDTQANPAASATLN